MSRVSFSCQSAMKPLRVKISLHFKASALLFKVDSPMFLMGSTFITSVKPGRSTGHMFLFNTDLDHILSQEVSEVSTYTKIKLDKAIDHPNTDHKFA